MAECSGFTNISAGGVLIVRMNKSNANNAIEFDVNWTFCNSTNPVAFYVSKLTKITEYMMFCEVLFLHIFYCTEIGVLWFVLIKQN